MSEEISMFRLYLMRALYLLNFLLVLAVPGLIKQEGLFSDPFHAVAISFWAALFVLSGLGLRYPLKMLPLLFMQLFYKLMWLITVALPLWSASRSAPGLTKGMVIGAALDLIVIPWPYVLANYVKAHGDRWRGTH